MIVGQILWLWDKHYDCGTNTMIVGQILWLWDKYYDCGTNTMIVGQILWLWDKWLKCLSEKNSVSVLKTYDVTADVRRCVTLKMHRGINLMLAVKSCLRICINRDSRIWSRRHSLLAMISGLWYIIDPHVWYVTCRHWHTDKMLLYTTFLTFVSMYYGAVLSKNSIY